MTAPKSTSEFCRKYDLAEERRHPEAKIPAPHQTEALDKLNKWYGSSLTEPLGGILVLPTGGGKTFTACHFICRNPLSHGFKVLWLAHTHHLLEQAHSEFSRLVGLIAEPKLQLNTRVVSGTPGHFPVSTILPSDDVVVSTLQTVCNALNKGLQQLDSFLESADGRLFVVFDEAHHSPAPSYRKLMQSLRERCPQMRLLGLTATPTYSEEKKRGWLQKLFPQGIIYQVAPQTLMAAGILARPVLEEPQTTFDANFDEREYEKWVGTNRDLPDSIIKSLAESRERNEYIANCYVSNRVKYGKTIIFADRWEQCEQISAALTKRGVKADAIYSHVDANPGSVEARNLSRPAENARVLQAFRDRKLDVLINIRMLTEGTDVPDVQTVFLTRQTTSQILLTQMVGRALRGPKFGGTDEAFIVSFIDNWKHRINWAAYDQLGPELADDTIPEYGKRPPLHLISIELVRRLAQQMDSGINVNPAPYKACLPIGWYRVAYDTRVEGSDDIHPVDRLIMVFEDERTSFERFVEGLQNEELEGLEEDTVRLGDVRTRVDKWCKKFFSEVDERAGGGQVEDIFSIARHMAQDEKQPPTFFPFEDRDHHDLDDIAQRHRSLGLNADDAAAALEAEYTRKDRYWKTIYPILERFESHYDACMRRIQHAKRHGNDPAVHRPSFTTPEMIPDREPSEDVKELVKKRDGKCACCGDTEYRNLQVDHISPSYHRRNNELDNLQTLCKICNGPNGKGIKNINFDNHQTTLTEAPTQFPMLETPKGTRVKNPEWWEMFLRRTINLFFRCASVATVEIGERGDSLRIWRVRLFPGNTVEWLQPHLPDLQERIRQARKKADYKVAPDEIMVTY